MDFVKKVNVSYCISMYIEQVHLSTELRHPRSFGGAYSSCCNLGGCTDPVLLIHRVFTVYYLELDVRRTSSPAKTPSLVHRTVRVNGILWPGGKLCCKIQLCDEINIKPRTSFLTGMD